MKIKTVLKKLRQYERSLQFMEAESMSQQEFKDAEHYRFDKEVMKQAIKIIEEKGRSNT